MAEIVVTTERTYRAAPAVALAAVRDYAGARERALPPQLTDWRVLAGGDGAGTTVAYALHATQKRVRQVEASVSAPTEHELAEQDLNSSLLVGWSVAPAVGGTDSSTVSIRVSWTGAGGIGGFFERRFAPAGIKRIYDDLLTRLGAEIDAVPGSAS